MSDDKKEKKDDINPLMADRNLCEFRSFLTFDQIPTKS